MKKTAKKSGCLSFALYFLLGSLCLSLCFGVDIFRFQIFSGLIGFLSAWRIFRNLKRNATIDLEEAMGHAEGLYLYNILSQKKLTKLLIAKELRRQTRCGEKMRCKAVLYRKAIYCAVALTLGTLILFGTYYKSCCIPLLWVLVLVFLFLWIMATPEQVLYEKARLNKKVPFEQLVRENLYDEAATPLTKIRNLLAIGALVLLFAVFFQSTSETRIKTVPTEGGVTVASYRPALQEMETATIPKTLDGQTVVAIDDNVFQDFSKLREICLPDSVTSIGARAFKNCKKLGDITLPASLTVLGGEAFKNCSALMTIEIPKGVTELRGNTFEGCSNLKTVQLHDGITAIHAYCFRGCKGLVSIQLPKNITEIRTYTFEGCSSLEEIDIPAGVTRIASHAFHNCTSLSSVYLPDTLTEIGNSAFRNCTALQEIGMPKGVTVAENAFKESPTEIGDKKYTDQQWNRILRELEDHQWPDALYYMYNKEKGSDAICRYGTEGYIVLADRQEFKARISDDRALKEFSDDATLLALLEKAKAEGVNTVKIYIYTQVGSEIIGGSEFVSSVNNIDAMIAQLKDNK